ncbi:beta-ketoacyl-[acyl-carrier-protein] synthase family protein [Gilvimarinus agarilyticus]|uniref:beta-ketoacyl-[acyl-carrier-protein] synthase family protein n=1 Tax=Reichenbachiella agariperforans TaxID=156994 RepID=UPI001C0A1B79|nr:beta-ketoacyl-[acyl-carrier-protein] synthase family protein [Reichenbachiella agariperforans]MBU2884837.1 beta-ketoacyl-[acyl-carrier-protein] synthase family protein [Gilvimarinus agarilyticus]MBU2913007.1 beta-ketoacyl-[acyl-carrier-protein] synthase family protein [Reichenbachiella agariperforans]
MNVYVTGIGVVSALGIGVAANQDALASGRTGIVSCETRKGPKLKGCLSLSDEALKSRLGLELSAQVPRTAMLAMLAAEEALGDTVMHTDIRSGFINGTTTGGMDLSEAYFSALYLEEDDSEMVKLLTHDLGTVTQLVNQRLGFTDYVNTLSTACSSAANAIMLGARMIKAGMIDRVLVGGVDALTDFTVDGFGSLMIYDSEHCRPFDEERVGLNLGEGAGFLLIENDKSLAQSQNKVLARCAGWANANDAYHQTGTSPEGNGAALAMIEALKVAQLTPSAIDYLNAHGTATKNNDNSELSAIDRVFEGVDVDFSSTKANTGHTLAAAGGIEAVYGIMSILTGAVFPNLNWKNKMLSSDRKPVLTYTKKEINAVMSNSFGFGGNSTSLIFTKA